MLDGLAEYGYWGLLLASFLAATILPFSSEVVFAALIAAGMDIWTSILYATAGNALGGATCYYLGRMGKTEWLERWFKIKPAKIEKTIEWMSGKGAVMGFFGFMPVVGDVMLVALGFMRANIPVAMLTMTAGKFLRYLLIGFGTDRIIFWF
ncbi:MAG: YqaA family protein [Proteiniphilum sp.]|jgi:membrane protein YqaA with SNARE-associated domain|nr:DedA family protein [Porphyromonadaceae bacterium]MDD2314075.1 DedA family protein [Proteiniphilum sp.]NCB24147.1 DedA family protein [Bacteroidia bacterium]MDD2936818.1 DedA family protein [Proteiniphilum sp.]MDD3075419.1 DedA family protein [Proteiniphilum sp.]